MVTLLLVKFFCLSKDNYTILCDSIPWLKCFLQRFFVCSRRITLYLLIHYGDQSTSHDVFLSVRGELHYIFWFNMVTKVLLVTFFCLFEENYTISFYLIWWPKIFLWRRITLNYLFLYGDLLLLVTLFCLFKNDYINYIIIVAFFCLFEENHTKLFD